LARSFFVLFALLFALVAPLATARAADPPPGSGRDSWPGFGAVSIGFHGGFQLWSLDALEQSLAGRNESFAQDGYQFNDPSFGIAYAFGADFQYRLSRSWFAQLDADWTRVSFDDRDRQTIAFLGGSDRPAVSVSYTSRVETRPLVFAVGLGRAFHTQSVRYALAAQGIVAPLKVVDEFTVFIDEEHETRTEAAGVGFGGGGSFSADYLTETNMTLFVDLFFRIGAADVDLDNPAWESDNLPGTRRVDFTGGGIRLGVRWT
jgi:hypothetical protein